MFCANFRVAYFLLLRFIVGHLYQQIKSDMFVAAVFSRVVWSVPYKKEARKEILNFVLRFVCGACGQIGF